MGPDILDILAVIFGILFTIRKLDVSSRQAKDFPRVDKDKFEAWRAREASVYSVALWACFLKFSLDMVLTYAVTPSAVRSILNGALDLTWLATLVVTMVRAGRARKEREQLGIALGGFRPPPSA